MLRLIVRCISLFMAGLAVLLLCACGGGGSSASANGPNFAAASNEQAIYVNAGPPGTGYNANRLYADVTVCEPGTSKCLTIPYVLVDTGSTGLRLLNSSFSAALSLPRQSDTAGRQLVNCARFVDGSFAWGAVARVDIQLGAKVAGNVPMQIMADPAVSAFSSLCSGGSAIVNSASIGANGILGVGLFKEDCGSRCASQTDNGYYFSCTSGSCLKIRAATATQVKNPIPLLASDNNGVVIDLPGVGAAPSASLVGKMVFGIGSQPNNQLINGQVLPADARGYVTTTLAGTVMRNSFFDTGSNGFYFDTASLPACAAANATSFYCPATSIFLTATVSGGSGGSGAVGIGFAVDNALDSFVGAYPVLPGLAGTLGNARSFDWGLPFFYGRRVFFGIEGMASNLGTGPFYAF